MIRVHGKPIDITRLKKFDRQSLMGQVERVTGLAHHLMQSEAEVVTQETCYICGATTSAPFAEVYGFDYVSCMECSHVYTTRRYPENVIQDYYRNDTSYSAATYANPETYMYRRQHVALPKVEFAETHSGLLRGAWIDVGCGIGDMVSVAGERGWNATGLELSENSVAFAKKTFGLDLCKRTLEEFSQDRPDLKGKVDMVSFMGVLEHLTDPMEALDIARGLLKPSGCVYIQVPNAHSFSTFVQAAYPENVWRHMSPNEHIMLFSENSLTRALNLAGFSPIVVWYHGQDVSELLNSLIMTNPRVRGSSLEKAFQDSFNELQQVFDDRELSDRIICLARNDGGEER